MPDLVVNRRGWERSRRFQPVVKTAKLLQQQVLFRVSCMDGAPPLPFRDE